ncbi:cytoskeleton-associated protein 5-like isoform X2 [Gigantopelta aegis]|uniref:cytoskeleton-associated protein 5-like isoform X2 n=1 Tax=Gigantopelta aegis TaxID=1735272 RepID=UPI001B88AB45|nr:cytoskeleton-associated protein 5-like isoform X2 [Gigantopelta aegis]
MGDDTEWLKLPTEEKCQHKVWKARLAGYEEAVKLFRRLDDEKSPEFSKYAGQMKKFVTDSNAIAQDKALDAVLAFVENAAVAGRIAPDVVNGCITKVLNSSKQKTKDKGIEIILMFVEIDKPDVVQEELLGGLENKNPKVVTACVQTLTGALRVFGSKVIKIKPCVKVLPKLLEDRDKNVRDETKQLCIELYRWIGAALKPQMAHFKPVLIQELEAEFEKLPGDRPVQTRFMRSQQDLKAKMEEQTRIAGDGIKDEAEGAADAAEEVDPYDLMDAVDLLSQLPKDFYEKIEAKKWQERREALDTLQKLSESPRLEQGDYGNLVRALLKVIAKDSNILLVAIGAKCLAGIAKGLRKKFAPYAVQSVSTILEKFKEKKPAVVQALREAIDAIFPSITFEMIMEDVLASLENKNPSIRAETALFLARCFARCTVSTLPKKQLKVFCNQLLKTVNDTTPEVREASYAALGTAMKVVSEKHILSFLVDVDSIKMQKIQENCEKAVLLNSKGEPRQSGASGDARPKASEPKPVVRPSSAKPATKGSKSSKGPEKKSAPGKSKVAKKGSAVSKEEPIENALSDETVEEKAAAAFPADVLTGLGSSNWKERLAAMEKISEIVKNMSREEILAQVFVRTISKKPGLKDNNFQVLKLKIEFISYLAKNSLFSKRSAEFCLPDLVEKVGDTKNGSVAQEALGYISEATGFDYVGKEVLCLAFENKNPKIQSESLNWLSQSIKEFGFKLNIKQMIENIKKALGATNPAVRTAAISLLGTLYMYIGDSLRVFFEDEKAALLQQIDTEFEKGKGQKPPTPTRGLVAAASNDAGEEEVVDEPEEVNIQDLIPRNDICDKITDDLLMEFSDKAWKVRGEALQKVVAILNEAKFITPNLGELPAAIKQRLADANKILVTTTIGICQTLAKALGPHCKAHIRVIGPGLISCMGDSKTNIRALAVTGLNSWVEHSTLTPLVECEAIQEGLKMENPFLRAELLGWLCEKLPNHKPLPAELRQCIPSVIACLEDRNSDVRKKSQESLVPFMIHTGYDSFAKAASTLKPASKDKIIVILEKARGNLPAKPTKARKVAPAATPVESSRFDELDEENKPPPAASTKKEKSESKPKTAIRGKAKAPVSSKKKEEEDTSAPITVVVSKEQRFKDEKNMKVLKWNFIEIRPEYVDQLKLQMEKNFSKSFMDQLFHADFKCHTKAIQLLIKCLETNSNQVIENMDVILKWLTIRFYDTNPSMLNKALEFLQLLFSTVAEEDYHMHDIEASSFLPYLILKVGDSKDTVRREVRKIFKLIYKSFPASKMFCFFIDGLKSKNSKQRAECLDELGFLIELYGITICQPSPAQALKIIAQQIGDRDNSVRNAALNTIVTAYLILGESTYKYIGTLNDKEQSLLDERIKRSAKNKPSAKIIVDERPKTTPLSQRTMSQPNIHQAGQSFKKSASAATMEKPSVFEVQLEPDSSYGMPNLLQLDVDELYDPVEMPQISAHPSATMKLVDSKDASATIGFVLSQITSSDINMCIQALTQIDEVLKNEERAEIMTNHMDQLLMMLAMQFKLVYSTFMGDPLTNKDDIIKLYKCLLGTLLAALNIPSLAKAASKDILKDVLHSLITMILDNRLEEFEEGPQVIRSVNVTVVTVIEKSDHTNVMSALIRLLQDCVNNETCSNKFLELVMKCLWKMMRLLPDIVNTLNLDHILMDCNSFLLMYPSSRNKGSDLTIRTMNTILHSLAKLKGNKMARRSTGSQKPGLSLTGFRL